jgi:hypothetical protein
MMECATDTSDDTLFAKGNNDAIAEVLRELDRLLAERGE